MKKRGNKLHPDDKAHVLSAYVYRNTRENPFRLEGGSSLAPISDRKWLEITDFAVRDNGRLNRRVKELCCTHYDEVPEWQAQIERWAKNRKIL